MTEGNIARHRNYGLLMKRHRRDLRIRRLTIALIYLLIIIAVTVLYIIVRKDEQHRRMQQQTRPVTATVMNLPSVSQGSGLPPYHECSSAFD